MYARRVTVQLKANSVASLTEKMENEVLPLLRKQEGFQDALTFVSPDGVKSFGITLWESKENAESYVKDTYPQVEKILAPLVEGTAHIGGFNVVNSTFHKVGATVTETDSVPVPATVPA
jgi:hypothetical protein